MKLSTKPREGGRGGGGDRSDACDVFVKRCRLGTKEARLNCAPRGSVTGGREVADKRELYKMGCTAPYKEGAPCEEREVVGCPWGTP